MQELGEEAESLQQVAGGTSKLKGHPGADIAIGAVGIVFLGAIDHFANKGRIRRYLFESRGTGEAGNIAQDAGQVILRDDQQLIKEGLIKNSNAIENSSLVERQKSNLIIRPEQEAQADAARAVAVRKDPDLLIKEANKALSPEEMTKFLAKVANDNLNALEEASWKEMESYENVASIQKSLNTQVEESLAKIEQIEKDICEILLKVDPNKNVENAALEYWVDRSKTNFKIYNLIMEYSWGSQEKQSEVMVKYSKLFQAWKEEKDLIKDATRFKVSNVDLYKQYYQKVIDDNPSAMQELLKEEEAKAAKAVVNQIEGEANQVISTDVLNMAEKVIKGDGIEAVKAAEHVVSEELKIEVEEIEVEIESAVEKEEAKVISDLV